MVCACRASPDRLPVYAYTGRTGPVPLRRNVGCAIARALRLDPAERRTPFALARTELPLTDDVAGTDPEELDGDISQLIRTGRRPMIRILAWNGQRDAPRVGAVYLEQSSGRPTASPAVA